MTTTALLKAGALATPRGARVAAELFVRLLTWTITPKPASAAIPAAALRALQAAEVRELAYREQARDPRFAADLFAAADRHTARDD